MSYRLKKLGVKVGVYLKRTPVISKVDIDAGSVSMGQTTPYSMEEVTPAREVWNVPGLFEFFRMSKGPLLPNLTTRRP
jgi:hypothetical protein